MSSSPSTRKYVLTVLVVEQLLGDPDFYRECPAFAFLAKKGLEATALLREVLRSTNRNTSNEADAHNRLNLVTASFMRHVGTLHDLGGPELLQPLKMFLCTCLDSQADEVVLSYMAGGERNELIF